MEILKDDILQLNFHTFIGSWAQFEELHGPFVNLGAYLPPKHNSPFFWPTGDGVISKQTVKVRCLLNNKINKYLSHQKNYISFFFSIDFLIFSKFKHLFGYCERKGKFRILERKLGNSYFFYLNNKEII